MIETLTHLFFFALCGAVVVLNVALWWCEFTSPHEVDDGGPL